MADIIIEHKSAEVGTTTPNESIEVIVSRHSVDCIVGGSGTISMSGTTDNKKVSLSVSYS